MSYTLFPRTEYVDGEFSDVEINHLEICLQKYLREDPEGFQRSTQRVSGMKPKEFYEGFASACDQIVHMFREEYVREMDVPYRVFLAKLSRAWGSALVAYWAMKKVKSVFEDLR